VSLAGKPSKAGGLVVAVLGWVVLIGGVSLALLLGLLLYAFIPGSIAGLAVGIPIGFASIAFGLLLLFGGRKLRRTGAEAARETQIQAILALAAHREGTLTARDAALALDMPVEQADAILTQMAKERMDEVNLEVDSGEVVYTFAKFMKHARARIEPPNLRIDAGSVKGRIDEDSENRPDEAEGLDDSTLEGPRRRRAR
jgi:hypothetical protein